MRQRSVAKYSTAGLDPLPLPITTDVHIALQYANGQVFGRLFPKKANCCAVSPPPSTPEPHFRDTSTQVSVGCNEEKSVMTQDSSGGHVDKSTSYEVPEPLSPIPVVSVEVGSQAIERANVSQQTSRPRLITVEETPEPPKETPEPPPKESPPKSKRKKLKIHDNSAKLKAEFDEKQKRFEALAAEQEAMERLAKEEREKAAAEAQALQQQQRKALLLEKHNQYLEKKKLREEQRKAAEEGYRKLKSVRPLHEKLIAEFEEKESMKESQFRLELEKVRSRMRRVEAAEIEKHEEKYLCERETKIEERSRARSMKVKQISEENMAHDYFQNHLLEREIEERKMEANRHIIEAQKARELLAKQRMYAQIAMEIHRPKFSISPQKTQTPKPVVKRPSVSITPVSRHVARRVKSTRPLRESTHRSPSEASTIKDYNSERRIALQRSIFTIERSSPLFTYESKDDGEGTVEGLRRRAGVLSREARRGEAAIGRLERDPELFATACDNVSAMYLDSIKAKLRIVNSLFG